MVSQIITATRIPACTLHRPTDNSDHKPKTNPGQSDLGWKFITENIYIVVLPAERHNPWARCYVLLCIFFSFMWVSLSAWIENVNFTHIKNLKITNFFTNFQSGFLKFVKIHDFSIIHCFECKLYFYMRTAVIYNKAKLSKVWVI